MEPDTLRAARRYFDASDAPPAGLLLVALAHNQPAKAGITIQVISVRVVELGKAISGSLGTAVKRIALFTIRKG